MHGVANRTYRYLEVAGELRAQIEAGEFGAGGMLPSEATLSSAHDTSRVTVRKALEALRDEGLVDSRQGFGWFVGSEPLRQSLDTLDTLDHQLEAAGVRSERKILSFGYVDPPQRVAASLGPGSVLEVRRLSLADGEPFALVTVWCDAAAASEISRADVERSAFQGLLSEPVGSATQSIGATIADADTSRDLAVPESAPLLRIRRVTRSVDGRNVLVSEHLYPAHRTEFSVELASLGPTDEASGLRLVHAEGESEDSPSGQMAQ